MADPGNDQLAIFRDDLERLTPFTLTVAFFYSLSIYLSQEKLLIAVCLSRFWLSLSYHAFKSIYNVLCITMYMYV